MHNVVIYFVGGTSIILEEMNDVSCNDLVAWLDSDLKSTIRIDVPTNNKTKVIRKDLILFIDII